MKNWMLVFDGEDERVDGTPIVEAETREEALDLMVEALNNDPENEVFNYFNCDDEIVQTESQDPYSDMFATTFDTREMDI